MTTTGTPAAANKPVPVKPVLHVAERRGEAMGSTLHIAATGPLEVAERLTEWAAERVHELEQRWSRFIAASETSRINDNPGTPIAVSADTIMLVTKALEARELSGGRFDPTMLRAMQANGYDRTFVSIKTPVGLPALDTRRIGLGQIQVDSAARTVTLDRSTGFDPGGIGKGLAADLVAEEMITRGAAGALVNIGGDVRCIGAGPADGTWVISVGDVVAGVENQVLELAGGGVATSTRSRRRWQRTTSDGVVDAHHLLDPTTGRSSEAAASLVTVIAARCADAEWLATAIASEGALPTDLTIVGDAAVMLTDHLGDYTVAGSPERFLR